MLAHTWNPDGVYSDYDGYSDRHFFRLVMMPNGSVALGMCNRQGKMYPECYIVNFGLDGRMRRYKNIGEPAKSFLEIVEDGAIKLR